MTMFERFRRRHGETREANGISVEGNKETKPIRRLHWLRPRQKRDTAAVAKHEANSENVPTNISAMQKVINQQRLSERRSSVPNLNLRQNSQDNRGLNMSDGLPIEDSEYIESLDTYNDNHTSNRTSMRKSYRNSLDDNCLFQG